MEVLRGELEAGGYQVNTVAINVIDAASTQDQLASRCSFDLLQDLEEVNAWGLLGGGKDDFFIFRRGGTLAPGGHLPAFGPVNTDLSTTDGYASVRSAIVRAHDLGPGPACDSPSAGGLQLPGNLNQDRTLNLSDAVALLGHLFRGSPSALPCAGGPEAAAGNQALLDSNADLRVNLSDAIYLLNHLFNGGPPPGLGTACVRIRGCPDACAG